MLSDISFWTQCSECSSPPAIFRLYTHPIEQADQLLDDNVRLSCPMHSYPVREGVLLALSEYLSALRASPKHRYDDASMLWSFTATSEIQGLVEVKIGVVERVLFDEPFEEIYNVTKTIIDHKKYRKGWEYYPFEVCIDNISPTGFTLFSSFTQGLPSAVDDYTMLVGWNAYGRLKNDDLPPIWRRMLANAHKHSLMGVWYLALLEAAFALESFLDGLLSSHLVNRDIPDRYIRHVLRVGERLEELRAIRDIRDYPKLSNSQINKLNGQLDSTVFSPRNNLAHGKCTPNEIKQQDAMRTLKAVQEMIWDWDVSARNWLLLISRDKSIFQLRDEMYPDDE